ncbi:hypothetical protein [Alicyclobacillus fastidiosus]|uniref:Uncharacterized protein n=1 Tax=Alicyclobacillus fastidiosus TaxID=392011 RepID=A0ABV5AIM8_9BACL|nr:hypothetical protein [Alicyclobacillus fastidiosus]WEH09190.1 hypothetical protein PYS47_21365 [Alicyclobacillus fastidiosus]
MVLTDEVCEAIMDEVYESEEYQNASSFLEAEIIELLGDNEEKWAKHNDAYVALENAIVRKLFQRVYASGVNDGKQIAVAAEV